MCVLQAIFAFEEASVVRADVRRERVLPEAHLAELVRRHAVGAQRDDPRLQCRRECCAESDDEFVGRAIRLELVKLATTGFARERSGPGVK